MLFLQAIGNSEIIQVQVGARWQTGLYNASIQILFSSVCHFLFHKPVDEFQIAVLLLFSLRYGSLELGSWCTLGASG